MPNSSWMDASMEQSVGCFFRNICISFIDWICLIYHNWNHPWNNWQSWWKIVNTWVLIKLYKFHWKKQFRFTAGDEQRNNECKWVNVEKYQCNSVPVESIAGHLQSMIVSIETEIRIQLIRILKEIFLEYTIHYRINIE